MCSECFSWHGLEMDTQGASCSISLQTVLECSYREFIEKLVDHFHKVSSQMIFEEEPPCMSCEAMDSVSEVDDWFASLDGTQLRVFGCKKPLHLLSRQPQISWSCKRLHIILPQVYKLYCEGKRKHPGLLFLCSWDPAKSRILRLQKLKAKSWRTSGLTQQIIISTIPQVFASKIVPSYISTSCVGPTQDQRRRRSRTVIMLLGLTHQSTRQALPMWLHNRILLRKQGNQKSANQ